jgi:hypothetical protein
MKHWPTIGIAIVLFCIGAGTTQPRSLDDVENAYRDERDGALANYRVAMSSARQERIKGMRALQDQAMARQDLTEAEHIQAQAASIQTDEPPPDEPASMRVRRALESRLAGSHWNCPEAGVVWTLSRDGTYTTTDGRGGEWAAVGAARILLRTSDGYVDEWTFNDALTSIDDLHGLLGAPWHANRAG